MHSAAPQWHTEMSRQNSAQSYPQYYMDMTNQLSIQVPFAHTEIALAPIIQDAKKAIVLF